MNQAGNTMSAYRWRARYNDGTELTESQYVAYRHIDRTRLRYFELFHKESGALTLRIEFQPGQRLIWRRMYAHTVGKRPEIAHLVGKQQTVEGENTQSLALLFEKDGTVEFFDRFNPKHPFLRGVQLLPFEV